MKLDIKLLIATAIAGLAGFVLTQILYNALVDTMARSLLIAILVAVVAVIVCVTISVMVTVFNTTMDEFLFLEGRGLIAGALAVCMVLLVLFSSLLEWIYDHETIHAAMPTSYIFLLDESGSMQSNDPDLLRYEAVNTVVSTLGADAPYAVYLFSDGCERIRDMAPNSAGKVVRPDDVYMGQTNIRNALTVVYNDMENGQLAGGDRPLVVLLTDGYASDMGWIFGKGILKTYKQANIMISPIGLGDVDKDLMTEIAEKTKGQFVLVNDASQLAQGFTSATTMTADRDLISSRNVAQKNCLYLVLRIVFLTLIGAAVAFMRAMACADPNNTVLVLCVGAAAAFVTALIMELWLAAGLPPFLPRLLYWLALTVTPMMVEEHYVGPIGDRQIKTSQDVLNGGGFRIKKDDSQQSDNAAGSLVNWDD